VPFELLEGSRHHENEKKKPLKPPKTEIPKLVPTWEKQMVMESQKITDIVVFLL
tara:strand:+ start:165 stop:326 length:162 start_codon:yes stop_codon:yes gene_type:complete